MTHALKMAAALALVAGPGSSGAAGTETAHFPGPPR